MTLNLATLSVVLILLTTSLSILLAFIWRTSRTYPGFGLWAAANAVTALGFLFLTLREIFPDFLTLIIGNTLLFGSFLISFLGHRKFLGLGGGKAFSVFLLALNTSLLWFFTFIDYQLIYRIILISLLLALVSARAAFDFGSAWLKKKTPSYKFVSAAYLTFSVLMIGRAVLTYLFSDIENLYAPDWIQSLSFIVFILFTVAWTFIFMILNNERLHEELLATKAEFERLAATDHLTGVNNNRRFFEIGEAEIQRAKRFHHPLALIMFDIDFFKKVNDTYGHSAGDRVLAAVAEICKLNLRKLDTIGRLGGEEFGVLLPHTDIEIGKTIAARLRRAFEENEIALLPETIKVTASFGVTEFSGCDAELKDLLARADLALYQAKQNGRNQVKTLPAAQLPLAGFSNIGSAQRERERV